MRVWESVCMYTCINHRSILETYVHVNLHTHEHTPFLHTQMHTKFIWASSASLLLDMKRFTHLFDVELYTQIHTHTRTQIHTRTRARADTYTCAYHARGWPEPLQPPCPLTCLPVLRSVWRVHASAIVILRAHMHRFVCVVHVRFCSCWCMYI